MSIRQRLSAALSPAAMLVAILALVLSAAGAGYAAGKIGTSDLKDNAVTSPKVKNGTLKAADLVKEKPFTYVRAAAFDDGGEGDCVWQSAQDLLPGLARVGYRLDRFGTVHLSGLVVGTNGPGGDGVCGDQSEDARVFRLPAKYRPQKHAISTQGDGGTGGTLLIVSRNGINVPGLSLPAGTVYWTGDASFGLILEGISFPAAGSKVYGRTADARVGTAEGRALLKRLGIG
ncbi:hypothetical protein [Nocardioides aestuarii]|uniref:Uncharacterized protein n=1 Tax=Nocardioides aestuarii TaxID=252231 RepID=A0ABW4TK41_9ACTN